MDSTIFDDMKDQPRYEPYESTHTYGGEQTVRHPPEGTVRRSASIPADAAANQDTPVTLKLLRHGQTTFNINCSPCHGKAGYGDGMVVRHGFPAPPSLHIKRLRNAKDSYIRHVIVHGLGKMPPYDNQVDPGDRTAVIAYIRALQRSQHARMSAVPKDQRSKLKAER